MKRALILPEWFVRFVRSLSWIGPLTFLSVFMAGVRSAAQDEPPPLPKEIAELARKYAGVTEWQGYFDSSTAGSISWGNPNFAVNGFRQLEARSQGHFTLKRSPNGGDPRRGEFSWVVADGMPGEATGREHEQFSLREGYSGESEEWRCESAGTVPMLRTEFTLTLTKQFVHLHPGMVPDEKEPNGTRTGQRTSVASGGTGQRNFVTRPINEVFRRSVGFWMGRTGSAKDRENAIREWAVVSKGPGVLTFIYESVGKYVSGSNAPNCTHRSRVILFPIYDDLEVEVAIPGYAQWRPEGSIRSPENPGNSLVARATLKSKTGKTTNLPVVRRFRFDLLDTSREPGVCLNWPLNAKDTDYDLRLAPEGGGELSDLKQKLEFASPPKDDKQQPYAEARIESFDFGGRATLQVVCELEDGREILGLMKGEGGGQDLVRLPKMIGPDWIAENWRKEKKVEKSPALDDNEKVDGQKDNGDGYTLYEEYRGWVVNGNHVEGDPERKDFFVLNLIGSDGRAGIELFEALSKLRVHSKLRRREMSQVDRLMNGNHRDAPHRVAQHGVWVKTFTRSGLGDNGADTPMTKAGVAGRPGITIGVGILARGDTESIFNQPFNLPARDTILAYDRAIAHELLHSVGVEHHGRGDGRLSAKWVSPRHPRNKVGRPYFRPMVFDTDGVLTLLDENGHDLATQHMTKYAEDRVKVENWFKDDLLAQGRSYVVETKGQLQPTFPSAEAYAEYFTEEHVSDGFAFYSAYLGEQQGEHAGDQDCVMRYYFAEFYPVKGKVDVYYQVTPGTERIGIDICHAGTGTGINASSHKPQSRYGNAMGGEGDCFSQICPNDAIPPRKVK